MHYDSKLREIRIHNGDTVIDLYWARDPYNSWDIGNNGRYAVVYNKIILYLGGFKK